MNKRYIPLMVIMAISMILFSASCSSCSSKKTYVNNDNTKGYEQISPNFDADTAYNLIKKQIDFGSRVPGTKSHKACGDYLSWQLSQYGANVVEQKANITHYQGQNIEIRNIIGSFNPEKETRILLFAHWDTRPFADQDSDINKQNTPIDGADDGASGVGVLLEIARQLQMKNSEVGVDIIFFDLEDWGQANFDKNYINGDWWCVGSRYWSKNPHNKNYKAKFGILLDMVGASNATFLREGYSVQYASNIVEKVWNIGAKLGFGHYFVQHNGGYITDDHVPIIENRRIPCVDIINLKDSDTGFVEHWHTHNDKIQNINKTTLKAVGQTVMEIIYTEK